MATYTYSTLIFRGNRYECENYKECRLKYCELWFADCDYDNEHEMLLSYDIGYYFTKEPNNSGGREFRLIKGTNIYVDCNLSLNAIKANMQTISDQFGYEGVIERGGNIP